ncbi:ROK family protein [Alteribacillus sp. JSM 102045]|uniref:ROK family protein n=1 Tax=Alteribacillus sp. JSM 102045 TaxID=1562101 RepID=UPI0035C004A8
MKRRIYSWKTSRIGIDLGGTKILGALVDEAGNVVTSLQLPTFSDKEASQKELLSSIISIINQLIKSAKKEGQTPQGIGIASAGIIDQGTRTIRYAQSLGVKDFSIGKQLEDIFQIPVRLCNDTDAAAMAKWQKNNNNSDSFMYVSVGTGIGAGIMKEGVLLQGAGEIGHMTVNREGGICPCGNRGCLKHYASGPAMEEKVRTGHGRYAEMTMPEIIERAENGDTWCQDVLKEGAHYLGLALVNAVHLLHIKEIALGGGVLQEGEFFLKQVQTYVHRYTMPFMAEGLTVKRSPFKAEIGAVGAACIMR